MVSSLHIADIYQERLGVLELNATNPFSQRYNTTGTIRYPPHIVATRSNATAFLSRLVHILDPVEVNTIYPYFSHVSGTFSVQVLSRNIEKILFCVNYGIPLVEQQLELCESS